LSHIAPPTDISPRLSAPRPQSRSPAAATPTRARLASRIGFFPALASSSSSRIASFSPKTLHQTASASLRRARTTTTTTTTRASASSSSSPVVAAAGEAAASEPFKWTGAKLGPAMISVAVGVVVKFLVPCPAAVVPEAWTLLAIFLSTITGLVLTPLPVGAWAFCGLSMTVVTKTLTFQQAFRRVRIRTSPHTIPFAW
jgi:hypothetical protein